jgi:DNA polymerase III delta prime subunit
MKGSILIFGGNQSARKERIQEILTNLQLTKKQSPDVLYIIQVDGKKSVGIGQVREAIKFLHIKPFEGKNKAVVVKKAHLLTPQAQNAFLKTLEEPPPYASIILSTKSEESLLPTVVSRCKKIRPTPGSDLRTSTDESITSVVDMQLGERLVWAEGAAKNDREEVIDILEDWVMEERKELTTKKAENIKKILVVKKDLEETNVNLRLALEILVLSLS